MIVLPAEEEEDARTAREHIAGTGAGEALRVRLLELIGIAEQRIGTGRDHPRHGERLGGHCALQRCDGLNLYLLFGGAVGGEVAIRHGGEQDQVGAFDQLHIGRDAVAGNHRTSHSGQRPGEEREGDEGQGDAHGVRLGLCAANGKRARLWGGSSDGVDRKPRRGV